eukprot:COSAG01_NODE_64852_length_275_cov_0.585227_2_plen_67_part_01
MSPSRRHSPVKTSIDSTISTTGWNGFGCDSQQHETEHNLKLVKNRGSSAYSEWLTRKGSIERPPIT